MSDAPPFLDPAGPDLPRWFDAPGLDAWRAEATRLLKGRSPDGFRLPGGGPKRAPLFTADDAPPAHDAVGGGLPWRPCALADAGDVATLAAQLEAEEAAGARSVWVVPTPAERGLDGDGGGLRLGGDLMGLLGAVDRLWIHVDAGLRPAAWSKAIARTGHPGILGVDPYGTAIGGGATWEGVQGAFDELVTVWADDLTPRWRIASLPWAEADGGEDPVHELAWILADAVATLRALDARGIAPAEALRRAALQVTVGRETMTELSKLRALRDLWARLAVAMGAPEASRCPLHVVTSRSLLATRDPWVNLLRTTHGAFVAALAGADDITMVPWDRALGVPDAHARRVAVTSQEVLAGECHLAAVADPAAGAWAVEALTDDLARAAWARFQRIEADGGFEAIARSACDGTLDLAALAQGADRRVATRSRGVLGVSLYPNPDEDVPARDAAPLDVGWREAAAWEALRDAADRGPRPTAYLAVWEAPKAHGARSGFARQLFEAGGFAVTEGAPDAAGDADVIVLCGTDDGYGTGGVAALDALGNRPHVVLAGKPEALPDGRVTHAVHLGADVLGILATLHAALGVGR